MSATTWSWTVVAALSLVGVGCGSTYDPPSLINKVRILAIRADPPVLQATAPTTLTPLVVGVPEGEALCYGWAFCPFAWPKDGNFRCFDARLQTELGTAASALVPPAALFKALAEAPAVFAELGLKVPDQVRTPAAGVEAPDFETYVLFKVATASSEGGSCPSDVAAWLAKPCVDRDACVAGYKRLQFVTSSDKVHHNPELDGLSLDGVDWPADVTPTLAWYRGDPNDTFLGLAAGATALLPRWSAASVEIIGQSIDPTSSAPAKESLLFSWYSTEGDYQKQRSFDDVPENAYLAPCIEDLPVQLWVVVRDGRNGVHWLTRHARIASKPAAGNPVCVVAKDAAGCP